MDNWHLKDFSLGDINRIQYIITAFNLEDKNDDHEVLHRLDSKIFNINNRLAEENHHLTEL
jgi:hypothetical protein